MMEVEDRMKPLNVTIDSDRIERLKETKRITRISKSEIVRIALDRLWTDLGDLNNLTPKAVSILYDNKPSIRGST